MSRRGGAGGGKSKVAFLKPRDPSFLTQFKIQAGYKEGPTLDTKREDPTMADDFDTGDKDDERPTVVVLKKGDISAEEAEKLNVFEDLNAEKIKDGKIVFKKPTKREVEETESEDTKNKKKKLESNMKQVKNKSLLSFDDEEDDDGESD